MAQNVKSLIKKYSDAGATDDMPPTPQDKKLRDKHISDSVPYNTAHATDHMEEIVNQLKKLKPVNPSLAAKLARQASKKLHKVEGRIK
jgi:hypothetical protein